MKGTIRTMSSRTTFVILSEAKDPRRPERGPSTRSLRIPRLWARGDTLFRPSPVASRQPPAAVNPLDARSPISRRSFLHVAGVGTVGAIAAACNVGGVKNAVAMTAGGRLTARPGVPTTSATPGEQPLSLGEGGRDGILYVPSGY